MLVLSRKLGESVVIGGQIIVTVTRVCGDRVRLGMEAPKEVPVHRAEIHKQIKAESAWDELSATKPT